MPITHDGIVFDCDGLLVDTQGAWDRAYQEIFGQYGMTLEPAARRRLVGLQLIPLGEALAHLLAHPAPPGVLGQQVYDLVSTNLGTEIRPMPGAVDLVRDLAGTRPLGIASNTPRAIVTSYLEQIGIHDLFDVVIGSDDVPHPKPQPDTYQAACTRLGLHPSRTLAFEDSAIGAQAAQAAGLHVIGVPSSPGLNLPAHHVVSSLNHPWLRKALGLAGETTLNLAPQH